MFVIGALLASAAIAGWRPLRSIVPSESLRVMFLVTAALLVLQVTGKLG
jgi:hypothetical protein